VGEFADIGPKPSTPSSNFHEGTEVNHSGYFTLDFIANAVTPAKQCDHGIGQSLFQAKGNTPPVPDQRQESLP